MQRENFIPADCEIISFSKDNIVIATSDGEDTD